MTDKLPLLLMTEAEIEALAVKHEAFGFGRVDAKGYTTHGFDPGGLAAFVRAITEEAVRLEREACARVVDEAMEGTLRAATAAAIRSRSKEG